MEQDGTIACNSFIGMEKVVKKKIDRMFARGVWLPGIGVLSARHRKRSA
jgi:hypothetical protein